jgi:hypothetical protein
MGLQSRIPSLLFLMGSTLTENVILLLFLRMDTLSQLLLGGSKILFAAYALLSCHGTIVSRDSGLGTRGGPLIALTDEDGFRIDVCIYWESEKSQ